MENFNPDVGKKRTLAQFQAQDLIGRLRSKADFYAYLDKHRTCPLLF